MANYLFIDTNIYLHYQPFLQINWLELLKVEKITIVVPSIVLRELEKQKIDNDISRIRKRSSEVLKNFEEMFFEKPEIKHSEDVFIYLLTGVPKIKLEDYQLDEKIQDHILIAQIISFKNENPSDEIYLASSDTSLKLEAKSHGIKAITPSDKYKIAEDLDDHEKKIKKLETQLAEYKNNKPDLKVLFSTKDSVCRFELKKPYSLSKEELSEKMSVVKKENPKMEKRKSDLTKGSGPRTFMELMNIPELTMRNEDIDEYNNKLDRFYKEYEDYLTNEFVSYENTSRRSVSVNLIIQNDGGGPAEDIDIFLHFPDGFELFEEDDYPEKPAPPSSPKKQSPLGTFGLINNDFLYRPSLSALSANNPKIPNVSSPHIKRTNSYDVNFHVKNLKHKLFEKLDKLFIVFDSFDASKGFVIEYKIIAGNVPKEIEGKLLINIEKES